LRTHSALLLLSSGCVECKSSPPLSISLANSSRPWSIACWAPSAFLGVEVNRMSSSSPAAYRPISAIELPSARTPKSPGTPSRLENGNADAVDSTGELSGLYFGILNIYNTLPQFIGTFISLIVFSTLEPGKSPELSDADPSEHHSTDGPNAISVCLLIGSFSMLGAAYATKKLRDLY